MPDNTQPCPSRRDFLASAASAAAFAALPHSVGGPLPILGRGDFRYTMDHHWAKLPASVRFGYTHGIVEDRAGRFYIANESRDAIVVVDAQGNYLSSWGQAYAKGAHGLRISEEAGTEYLYLANTSLGEVVKTTLNGDVVWQAGRPYLAGVYSPDRGYSPTETVVGPNGMLYVADGYGQSWIHVYDAKDGRYLAYTHKWELLGIPRSTYYRLKHKTDRWGLEALRVRERRRPRMPNEIGPHLEQRIIAFSLAHPGFGPRRISAELARVLRRERPSM